MSERLSRPTPYTPLSELKGEQAELARETLKNAEEAEKFALQQLYKIALNAVKVVPCKLEQTERI